MRVLRQTGQKDDLLGARVLSKLKKESGNAFLFLFISRLWYDILQEVLMWKEV